MTINEITEKKDSDWTIKQYILAYIVGSFLYGINMGIIRLVFTTDPFYLYAVIVLLCLYLPFTIAFLIGTGQQIKKKYIGVNKNAS